MHANPDCRAIVGAVAAPGSSLKMTTTAEGVETLEQLRLARDHGCTHVQGYYLSYPCPNSEVGTMLSDIAFRLGSEQPPHSGLWAFG